ncbi:retrovirus-related pol polyprotein from transposon TNT 1-94 [Tanacetum coccineum]
MVCVIKHIPRSRGSKSKSNTKNDRVSFASKSSFLKNKVEVEEHRGNLPPFANKKHVSCNDNVKFTKMNDCNESVYVTYKKCMFDNVLDACFSKFVNDMNSRAHAQTAKVSNIAYIKKLQAKDKKNEKYSKELVINLIWKFMGTSTFGNDHVAAIQDYEDFHWGTILITRVYYVEGLGYNLFSVRQFCDADLEVAFRRNTCFVRNLEGVDLLTGSRSTNPYTIILYEITYSSLFCLLTRATSTNSWLWHQCLSHLNFATINHLEKDNLVTGLSKLKYSKDQLCPSCEQGKNKHDYLKSKLIPSTCQKLDMLHMDLCGQMRVESINGKKYILFACIFRLLIILIFNCLIHCSGRLLNTAYPLPSDTAYPVLCPIQVKMTMVIKEEFEKIMDVKVEDVSLTCDTQLEIFNMEVSRLSRMDDDLFTYEVKVATIPCNSKKNDDSEDDDDDMGYDPSDASFIEWLRMILASVEKGQLVWPTIIVDGVTRPKEYTELTPAETIQADCDIKAINIILQGLPTEIYALVS